MIRSFLTVQLSLSALPAGTLSVVFKPHNINRFLLLGLHLSKFFTLANLTPKIEGDYHGCKSFSPFLSAQLHFTHPRNPNRSRPCWHDLLQTNRLLPSRSICPLPRTSQADLASLGYIVIGVDHPYDKNLVDLSRLSFVLSCLQNNTLARIISGVHSALDVSKVGICGHSLVVPAAASVTLADSRLVCGINLGGSSWGEVVDTGL